METGILGFWGLGKIPDIFFNLGYLEIWGFWGFSDAEGFFTLVKTRHGAVGSFYHVRPATPYNEFCHPCPHTGILESPP